MARQRMIKPEFFDSESLAACSIAARMAFIGLWVEADDYGRLKAQYTRLKTRIFPYDRMSGGKFFSLLKELEGVGCIRGYEVDGEQYIDIPNFAVYQTVKKPSKTTNPEYQEQYSTPLVPHQCPTSNPKERKKEGVSLDKDTPKEGQAEGGAVAGEPAPPVCPVCGSVSKWDEAHGWWECGECVAVIA